MEENLKRPKLQAFERRVFHDEEKREELEGW